MQYGKSQEAIDRLTAEQRRVTQEAGTEHPFTGEYNDHKELGIYPVEPLSRSKAPGRTPLTVFTASCWADGSSSAAKGQMGRQAYGERA